MLNFSSSLYKSEWLDLVFKNRNQNYGAFVLRAESSKILFRSLLIATPLFVMPFLLTMLNRQPDVVTSKEVIVELRSILENPAPKKQEESPKLEPIKEKLKTYKAVSSPIVVKDPVAEPPTLKEMENAVAGPVTQAGLETKLQALPEAGKGGTGGGDSGAGGTAEVDNQIYNASGVEVYPEFEGGMKGWAKYLQRNLRYPDLALEKDVQGRVMVSFVVEKDGSISDVKLISGIGSGCDEEALRVIRKSPRWKPGKQNEQTVRVRYTIPLAFALGR
ncbi:energy transducer TonB [Pedobacter gandavensis]|uniref:TonB family protein n=1 Tax=Pedobacter gandavensis TaxID=2679963 RepID=A0ABR6EV43_9SPHI|nr:energy transducer TonB [Pedobacter gandavensis]MBB2149066.1 TonB family protein [Pedobacter gandavensis]